MGGSNQIKVQGDRNGYTAGRGAVRVSARPSGGAPRGTTSRPALQGAPRGTTSRPALQGAPRGAPSRPAKPAAPGNSRVDEIDKLLWGDASAAAGAVAAAAVAAEEQSADSGGEDPAPIKTQPRARRRGKA